VQHAALRRLEQDLQRREGQLGGSAARMQLGEPASGRVVDLERALDALCVVGLDARGARGIDRGELGVQARPAMRAARASLSARKRGCAGGRSASPRVSARK
jgi:hypothetical protein